MNTSRGGTHDAGALRTPISGIAAELEPEKGARDYGARLMRMHHLVERLLT